MRVPGSGWRRVHLDQGLCGGGGRGGIAGSRGCGEESGRGLGRLGLGEEWRMMMTSDLVSVMMGMLFIGPF
jgi:hypothetical protein